MSPRRRRRWSSKAERFGQVGWRQRAMLAEAAAALAAARIRLLLTPFRRVAASLGTFVPPSDPRSSAGIAPAPAEAAAIAGEVGWAVASAARHVPFRAVCLPQAMAAHAMLKRRGIASSVHFGARLNVEKPIDAHAWLDAAGVQVTGYPLPEGMAQIGTFV